MQDRNVYLVLGCYGRKEDGFILCPSVCNKVLKLDDSLIYIDEIWDYLEAVRLLDKPLIDINAIRNLVYKMQDKFDQKIKKLWSEKEFNSIERFIHMHKSCGMFVKLELSYEEQIVEEQENIVKIKGAPAEKPAKPIFTQKTRSRR